MYLDIQQHTHTLFYANTQLTSYLHIQFNTRQINRIIIFNYRQTSDSGE